MRVLFHNSNRPASFGGIEYWMLDVAAGLVRRGHSAVLYGRDGAGWLREGARRGLDTVRGRFGIDLDPRAVLRLRATLSARAVDVVFVKGKKGARTAAAAAWLAGRGRVVLVLGIEGELDDSAVDRLTWRWAVDRAIVLAEEARRWYERLSWVRDGKLRVLLKGVDVDRLDPRNADGMTVRAALGIPASAPVIGSIGRLVWQKGHIQLLRAVAHCHARLPAARVLLVGEGKEQGRLEREAHALGIEHRVIFTGYRRDVAGLLRAMDVFALPSRNENMPQVLLEAMAMELPVVSTATIGVAEVLEDGHSGFIVPQGDIARLADCVLRLARSPELRARMGARGRERILENLTQNHMLTRVERLLEEVCERPGSGASMDAPEVAATGCAP